MGSLLLLVMIIFVVLFVIAVPTVISDLSKWIPLGKAQRQKAVKKEF